MLNLTGQRCVIIGGGAVAARRARVLIEAGALVHIIAPRFDAAIQTVNATLHRRAYVPGDLAEARLVVIATDDSLVNDAVQRDAREVGALVNRADRGDDGDLTFMACATISPVTLAVDSGCAMPAAAATIRDELAAALNPHWPQILTIAAPIRQQIAAGIDDAVTRHRLIAQLTSAEAVSIYLSQGSGAYSRYCVALARREDPAPAAGHEELNAAP